jgi:hypothetical protein
MECYYDFKKEPLPKIADGYDLIGLGFRQGPQLGKVLEEIRQRQISGEIIVKEEAINYARNLLNS